MPRVHAFDLAVVLASALDARLVVAHAWNPTGFAPGIGIEPHLPQESFGWMEGAKDVASSQLEGLERSARAAGVTLETRLELDPASRLLTDLADSTRAGLVVVGRRGHAWLAHVLLGSVSERVVRLSERPVLVVPEPNVTALALPRKFLVGIDYSDASRAALEAASELARDLSVSEGLILVHAVPDEREVWLEHWEEREGRLEFEWPYDRDTLEAWAAPARKKGQAVTTRLVRGRAESVLVDLAGQLDCDWIVAGVQGRTALASFLIGSTTDRVLRLADRPVLVVPPREAPPGEATA